MFDLIFESNPNWSWETFILYYLVSVVVVTLCKNGVGTTNMINGNSHLLMHKRNDNYVLFFLAYLILVILATIRSDKVGMDTWKYVEQFMYINQTLLDDFDWAQLLLFHQVEPLYLLFIVSVRSITDNYHVFFLCLYSLVAGAYILFIKYFLQKGMNCAFLKLFIIFYVGNMSGMRSALAMVPLLLSIIALDKRQYKLAISYNIAAIFCHYTMIYNLLIIVGVWIVRRFSFLQKKKWAILAFMVILLISMFGTSSLIGIFAETKYSFYTKDASEMSFFGSMIYVILGMFLLKDFYRLNNNKYQQTLFYIVLLLLISYPFLYVTAAYRIPNYYALPRLIIWCTIIDGFLAKNNMSKEAITLGSEIIVFAYMLMRFHKTADECFMYVI